MRHGTIYVGLSGHRKATSVYCVDCGDWHATPRGTGEPTCWRYESTAPVAPAVIPTGHLGSGQKRSQRVTVPLRLDGIPG